MTVGRAEVINGKKRIDKAFEVKKIYIHRQASYARVLLKCTSAVWGDSPENVSYVFSMLDGGVTNIPEELIIDRPDGTDKRLSWTLELYMILNKKNYTCNPRFNILRVPVKHGEYNKSVCYFCFG